VSHHGAAAAGVGEMRLPLDADAPPSHSALSACADNVRVDITSFDLSTPRPFFSARREPQELSAPLRQARARRLSARQRRDAERKLQNNQMHQWLSTHSLIAVPRVEISKTKKAALRECFAILDADGGGSIGLSELSLAMKALGFSAAQTKMAMEQGDRDGDGQLNFEEFVALLTRAGGPGGGDGGGGSLGQDSFPFALIANSYRISKLVDSHNPALHVPKSPPGGGLPPLAYAATTRLSKERVRPPAPPQGKPKPARPKPRNAALPAVEPRRGRVTAG